MIFTSLGLLDGDVGDVGDLGGDLVGGRRLSPARALAPDDHQVFVDLTVAAAGAGTGVSGLVGGGAATAAPSASVARPSPVVLLHLGGGPAEAGAHLVGDDLDDRALLALVGLPRALLEATGDEDACALLDGLTHVLAHVAPAH